jgi:hypothetical protein
MCVAAKYILFISIVCCPIFSQHTHGAEQNFNEPRIEGKIQCPAVLLQLPKIGLGHGCRDSCWLTSYLNSLEHRIQSNTGKTIPLSTEYNYVRYLQRKSIAALGSNFVILMSSDLTAARDLVEQDGVVPETVWKPKTNLTFESGNLVRAVDKILYDTLEKTAIDLDAKQRNGEDVTDERNRILSEGRERILKTIEEYTGVMPKTFLFEGEARTPLQIANYLGVLPMINKPTLYISKDKKEPDSALKKIVGAILNYRKLPRPYDLAIKKYVSFSEISSLVLSRLKKGRSTPISIFWDPKAIDPKTNIVSISGTFFALDTSRNHGFTVVGYEKTATGTFWLLQNTYTSGVPFNHQEPNRSAPTELNMRAEKPEIFKFSSQDMERAFITLLVD